MSYAIFRVEPINKLSDLAQIGSHNKREKKAYKSNPDIDITKTKDNIELVPLYNKTWIAYIEPPKGNPENVVEYVGKYSFRVAISNERIKNVEDDKVTFEYKDYKDNSKIKEMTISCEEFIRRFLLHVLPDNFTKIKHYGLLSNRNKKNNIRFYWLLISRILTNEFVSTISRKFHKFKCEKCGSTNFSYSFQYDIHRLLI